MVDSQVVGEPLDFQVGVPSAGAADGAARLLVVALKALGFALLAVAVILALPLSIVIALLVVAARLLRPRKRREYL